MGQWKKLLKFRRFLMSLYLGEELYRIQNQLILY
jgi:hypothetical protein